MTPLVFDVTSREFVEAIGKMDQLDVLVNNAGTNQLQDLAEVDDKTLDLLLNLNVRSAFQVSRAAALRMIALGRGDSIIHVSSQMGHVRAPKRSVYCMTKHAIEGLAKGMAIELAPQKIRVNAVAPTIVATPMTRPFLADPAYRAFAMATIPLKHVATGEDVAEAIVYLASTAARMVTGTSLRVDGGATAQ
ncbi:SDR family NAD(P)-dependent oxidoreductase [Bradyrhizobium sp. USDA 3315]